MTECELHLWNTLCLYKGMCVGREESSSPWLSSALRRPKGKLLILVEGGKAKRTWPSWEQCRRGTFNPVPPVRDQMQTRSRRVTGLVRRRLCAAPCGESGACPFRGLGFHPVPVHPSVLFYCILPVCFDMCLSCGTLTPYPVTYWICLCFDAP